MTAGLTFIDVTGRDLCAECAGSNPACFLCHGSGTVERAERIDAEDVAPVHGATSIRRHERPDYRLPISEQRERENRKAVRNFLGAILGAVALSVLFYAAQHAVYWISEQADRYEREQAELLELRVTIADYESWSCAQIRPEHRLNARDYKWCSRTRNER